MSDVEPEAPVQVTDGRQGIVERALDTGFVVPEPPYAVGGSAQDQEPEEALDGEDPEKQLAAQFLTPADQRGLRCRAAAVLPFGRVRAAAQAPPGRPRRGRNDQPLPQLRLARRVRHVALAGTAEQAPVHTPRISSRPPFSTDARDWFGVDDSFLVRHLGRPTRRRPDVTGNGVRLRASYCYPPIRRGAGLLCGRNQSVVATVPYLEVVVAKAGRPGARAGCGGVWEGIRSGLPWRMRRRRRGWRGLRV